MLVKFEKADGLPIWINPNHVDSVGYRLEANYGDGRHISTVVAGWVEIGMAADASQCHVVLGTPEEVVAKLFPQTRMPGEKFYVPV
jgi:hypothetical protein